MTLYIEGTAGASGDMLLGALLDLGYPIDELKNVLKPFRLDLKFSETTKEGLKTKKVTPILPNDQKKTWKLNDFLKILDSGKLKSKIETTVRELFHKIAEVEGSIHGTTAEKVHFHELAGWDTLFDLISVTAAFDYLKPSNIFVGPMNVGGGSVDLAHGRIPVPVPAASELLKNFFIYSSDVKTELVTPTGALLLSHFGMPSNSMPLMKLDGIGHGAGDKNLSFPNVLRIFSGAPVTNYASDTIIKLETNVDDMNPQFWDHAFESCYAAGALDVFLTPLQMKKNRPAYLFTVLTPIEKESAVLDKIFQETTTLGIRRELVSRVTLKRKFVEVNTPYGKIPCKIGYQNGHPLNIAPEYDVMKTIAKKKKVPLKELYQSVFKNWVTPT